MPNVLSLGCINMLNVRVWTLFLLMTCKVPVQSLQSPKFSWPLCHLSMAYDVVREIDAVYPQTTTCPTLAPGPPFLGLNVFLFDTASSDYASMKLQNGGSKKTWMVTMNVYLNSLDGVLVEHYSDSSDAAKMVGYTFYLDGGYPMLVGYGTSGTAVLDFSSSEVLTLETWTELWFGMDNGNVFINANGVMSQDTRVVLGSSTVDFVIDGLMHVGKATRPGRSAFKGRMCCLMIFHGTPSDVTTTHLQNTCKHATWIDEEPDTVAQDCPVTDDGDDVIALIPLTEKSRGYDVKNGVAPIGPADFVCLRTEAALAGLSSERVVRFDGSGISYISVPVKDQAVNQLVTVAIYLRPDPPSEGIVWEYVAHPSKPDGVVKMTLSLTPSEMHLDLYNAQGLCGRVVNQYVVPAEAWSFVYVIYNPAYDKAFLYVDNSGNSSATACGTPTAVVTNGVITVGGGFDHAGDLFGYRGAVGCLIVLDGARDRLSIAATVLVNCAAQDVDVGLTCGSNPFLPSGKFKCMSKGQRPTSPSNGTVPSRSSKECSRRCLSHQLCRAFVYNKLKPAAERCELFTDVTRYGLTSQADDDYYALTN